MYFPVARVVDLTDPALNLLGGLSLEDARARVASGDAKAVADLDGSYALVGVDGITVRLARSLDRPLRYFLAKEADGPVLVVADRIDAIERWLSAHGHGDQFHPTYTRMVPAHHVVTLRLVGCPDPAPSYARTFTPARNVLPGDLGERAAPERERESLEARRAHAEAAEDVVRHEKHGATVDSAREADADGFVRGNRLEPLRDLVRERADIEAADLAEVPGEDVPRGRERPPR